MAISTFNYCETIVAHPDLTKITSVSTYETLNLLHNKIKANAMVVNCNIGGGQQGYLILVVIPTADILLTSTTFVYQFHPGNFSIHIAPNRHTQEYLKRQYN